MKLAWVMLAAWCSVAAAGAHEFLGKPPEFWKSDKGKAVIAAVLSWQSDGGLWPKNTDTTKPHDGKTKITGTFDNGASLDEIRLLAMATDQPKVPEAIARAVDAILTAQYPTGGWPQIYPPPRSYHRHITYNDNAMANVMNFVRELAGSRQFEMLGRERREKAKKAFDAGIVCILKTQVVIDGRKTAWCAQHDEVTLAPAKARAYELPSLSGAESVGLVRLLMSVEKPSPETIEAVEAAMAWFEKVKITGIRVEKQDDPAAPGGKDAKVIADAKAPALWARFYDLKTQKPMFVDRDGVPRERLDQIGHERRNGYAWYGRWPDSLLEKEYPAWKKRLTPASP